MLLFLILMVLARMSVAAPDVTSQLEFLGNPGASYYPADVRWRYARNPWDLQVFDGKVYIGSVNSSNVGPAANAGSAVGPIPNYDIAKDGCRCAFF